MRTLPALGVVCLLNCQDCDGSESASAPTSGLDDGSESAPTSAPAPTTDMDTEEVTILLDNGASLVTAIFENHGRTTSESDALSAEADQPSPATQ